MEIKFHHTPEDTWEKNPCLQEWGRLFRLRSYHHTPEDKGSVGEASVGGHTCLHMRGHTLERFFFPMSQPLLPNSFSYHPGTATTLHVNINGAPGRQFHSHTIIVCHGDNFSLSLYLLLLFLLNTCFQYCCWMYIMTIILSPFRMQ